MEKLGTMREPNSKNKMFLMILLRQLNI